MSCPTTRCLQCHTAVVMVLWLLVLVLSPSSFSLACADSGCHCLPSVFVFGCVRKQILYHRRWMKRRKVLKGSSKLKGINQSGFIHCHRLLECQKTSGDHLQVSWISGTATRKLFEGGPRRWANSQPADKIYRKRLSRGSPFEGIDRLAGRCVHQKNEMLDNTIADFRCTFTRNLEEMTEQRWDPSGSMSTERRCLRARPTTRGRHWRG